MATPTDGWAEGVATGDKPMVSRLPVALAVLELFRRCGEAERQLGGVVGAIASGTINPPGATDL